MEDQKDQKESKEKLGEKKKEMVIEAKDTDIINRFFTHFKFNVPSYLQKAVTEFDKVQNLDTEENLKLALTKAVVEEKNGISELDDLFEPVINACGEMSYGLQFDQELAEIIGQDEDSIQNSEASSCSLDLSDQDS